MLRADVPRPSGDGLPYDPERPVSSDRPTEKPAPALARGRRPAPTGDLTFERAAFSPVISEGFDRSDGIYDRDTRAVIAQGELGLPIFVGVPGAAGAPAPAAAWVNRR
jgi:hypothetical protein